MMLVNLNTLKIVRFYRLNDLDKGLFEPYVLKGTRTVLWRVRGSNASILSDKASRTVLRRVWGSNFPLLSDKIEKKSTWTKLKEYANEINQQIMTQIHKNLGG